ncbi:hypothetical protein I3760_02G176900 [Carya illinoinensis]|nr:hypothetical protein I3760_02G176900 [Carya illinoinensis]
MVAKQGHIISTVPEMELVCVNDVIIAGRLKENEDYSAAGEPSTSTNTVADPEEDSTLDDDDELDMDELNELEASLSRTSIQIR